MYGQHRSPAESQLRHGAKLITGRTGHLAHSPVVLQASWDEELKGTTESISLDVNGQCLVERRDVWGRESPSHPGRGLRFG